MFVRQDCRSKFKVTRGKRFVFRFSSCVTLSFDPKSWHIVSCRISISLYLPRRITVDEVKYETLALALKYGVSDVYCSESTIKELCVSLYRKFSFKWLSLCVLLCSFTVLLFFYVFYVLHFCLIICYSNSEAKTLTVTKITITHQEMR